METFRTQTTAMSSSLIDEVEDAWRTYLRSDFAKGLPEADKPSKGSEAEAWEHVLLKAAQPAYRSECLKRDEKFDMKRKALVSAVFTYLH